MRFKGQLLLPGESGPGLNVNLDVAEHHLAVESDGGGLGAWPLEAVDVERLHGDLFSLTVAGEALRFVAEDTIGFAYSGVPAIEKMSGRSKSGVRSMFGRLWKGPEKNSEPAPVEKSPVTPRPPVQAAKPPVQQPTPAEELLEFDAAHEWTPPAVQHPIVVDEPVLPPSQVEHAPSPEPPTLEETVEDEAQCPAVRSDGERCESQILTDSGFCYPHDPRRAFEDGYQAAQEARAQLKKDATARLNRIYARLEKAMRQVERGELDPETAMAMAQLARTMCAILEMDEPNPDEG